jgi:SpoVK/Ycf46/Vps4 family AAA+-type ATPase
MAASNQIKSLITSFGKGDENRFFATAMQIAASESRRGHSTFAKDLKQLIDKAKKERLSLFKEEGKRITLSIPKRELQELIDVYQPRIKLDNMVLAPSVKEALEKLLKEQSQWELLKKFNLEPQRKLLLYGEPGTGKTMTAEAIAGELNIPVYIIRLDGLMSKYMGESISKLRLIFDAMVDHRAVYLFDEFDSIGSHRNQGQDVGEIKRVLNSFLINIEKDTSNSIIIAATNLHEALDKALFRRFDTTVQYPLPNEDEIEETIKKRLIEFKFNKRFAYKKVSKLAKGLNFSDINKACEETIKDMVLNEKEKLDASYLEKMLMIRRY